MSKLCRQVSIETPGSTVKDCVFSLDVPVPDVPQYGARIRVAYAGACYRANRPRSASLCSTSSITSMSSLADDLEDTGIHSPSPMHIGFRDAALFPGYEVAGVVDAIGCSALPVEGISVGTRIIVYPYDDEMPNGYSEYIIVPDLYSLVPIPKEVPLSVAAMLPSGALWASTAVETVIAYLREVYGNNRKEENEKSTLLIVGTGGLALWAMRIAAHRFKQSGYHDKVKITVATLKDEGFALARESNQISVVQWSEDLHEKQLIERTIDACNGPVDMVLNFGITSRTMHRSLQCLARHGMVLMTKDAGKKLMGKFQRKADSMGIMLVMVPIGRIELLKELVNMVASGEVEPPPHTVFPVEEAPEVVRMLCNSEIHGRAILKFFNLD